MEKFSDKSIGDQYASAMYKLKAVLKSADKDWVSTIESNVVMQPLEKTFSKTSSACIGFYFQKYCGQNAIDFGLSSF